jgi:hypothetical protein
LSKQKKTTNVIEDESLWTHEEGLLDVTFSNNDNFNEDVFEATIATIDVKGKDSSWYFDFGATKYVSGTREHFDNIESCRGNLKTNGR